MKSGLVRVVAIACAGGLIAAALPAASALASISGPVFGACGSGWGCVSDQTVVSNHIAEWNYSSNSDSGVLTTLNISYPSGLGGGTVEDVSNMRNRNGVTQRSVYVLNGVYFGGCMELKYDSRTWVNVDNKTLDVLFASFTVNGAWLYNCVRV